VFDRHINCLEARVERAHHLENYLDLRGEALQRVLMGCCLRPANNEQVRYKASVGQVWKYLDRAHLRQDEPAQDRLAMDELPQGELEERSRASHRPKPRQPGGWP
jgi:hypothetical protein